MIVNVHMTAFGRKDEVRPVTLPKNALFDEVDHEKNQNVIDQILELVFKYGQNDFQPLRYCSVSVGDIACLYGCYFLCDTVGWKRITKEEFDSIPGQGNISSHVYMRSFQEEAHA